MVWANLIEPPGRGASTDIPAPQCPSSAFSSLIKVPHAARCGHVCCKPCWEKWLNTGKTVCPLCRAPTSRDKITAVRLV